MRFVAHVELCPIRVTTRRVLKTNSLTTVHPFYSQA